MAITENLFTKEELKAALETNPTLLDVIKETATGMNVFVYKDTELNSFLETKKQEFVGEATSKIYSQLDQDVIALTGATKGQEKTYEFIKRVLSEAKTKQTELEGQIQTLDQQVKTTGADKTLQTKYEALEKEHNILKNETIPGLNTKYFQAVVGSKIVEAQKDLAFNPVYDKEVIDALVGVATQKMLAAAKTEGDTLQFLDTEGKPYMNGIDIASPKDVFLKFLPSNIIDAGRKAEGGGTGPAGKATQFKNPEGKEIVIPGDIKSKVQLHEFLVGQGLSATSKEFIEIDGQYGTLPTV